jgi:hypothetical protein
MDDKGKYLRTFEEAFERKAARLRDERAARERHAANVNDATRRRFGEIETVVGELAPWLRQNGLDYRVEGREPGSPEDIIAPALTIFAPPAPTTCGSGGTERTGEEVLRVRWGEECYEVFGLAPKLGREGKRAVGQADLARALGQLLACYKKG